MLPPFDGGLHCGDEQPSAAGSDRNPRAPAVQRRAPLRRPPRDRLHWRAAVNGAPAVRRRAPLRRVRRCPGADLPGQSCSRRSDGGLHCGNHPSTVTPPDSGRVFPPVDGGLHCGYLTGRPAAEGQAWCSRRPLNRLHCRMIARQTAYGLPSVLPPFNGGLHCGCRRTLPTTRDRPGAPAVRRRAPLRRRRRPCWCARRRPARPADHRRAPLRRTRPTTTCYSETSVPVVTGGLHCGLNRIAGIPRMPRRCSAVRRRAPLRRGSLRLAHTGASVLPPVDGGLHCGAVRCKRQLRTCAPAGHRRAPLRRRQRHRRAVRRACVPAGQRRAPLRLGADETEAPLPARCSRR